MANYAIGDIHGCYREFCDLLDEIDFDPDDDRIWHTGDLVNGGPNSVDVVRWFYDHPDSAQTVLGNHDLHLLAVAYGNRSMRAKDNFQDVLEAPDADELLDWLRNRSLLVEIGDRLLVHAGLLPDWSVDDARQAARQVEELLSSTRPDQLLGVMYGNKPRCLARATELEERWRLTINAMTRMRVLESDGDLNFGYKSTYEEIPEDKTAWFDVDRPAWEGRQIVCGHWSALGLHRTDRVVALDTGCRWGGKLTALRLEDEALFQVDSYREPAF